MKTHLNIKPSFNLSTNFYIQEGYYKEFGISVKLINEDVLSHVAM